MVMTVLFRAQNSTRTREGQIADRISIRDNLSKEKENQRKFHINKEQSSTIELNFEKNNVLSVTEFHN